jgi:hypothetical protein
MFFVSVASKGFSYTVSLLFATFEGRHINVAAKGLKARVGGAADMLGAGRCDNRKIRMLGGNDARKERGKFCDSEGG